jgi:hypothetical protein
VSNGFKQPPLVNQTQQYKIPVIINRFELLRTDDNHEEAVSDFVNTVTAANKNEENIENTAMDFEIKQRETNHKVLIIGDSHARGCAAEISDTLEETFEVLGIVCPGAGIDFISTYTMAEILQLTKEDVVIIWGGSNDVAKNEANQGIEKIMRVVESIKHTNVILLEAPCRYDLDLESCVNKEVRKFNNSLRNLMKTYDHAEVLPVSSDRSTCNGRTPRVVLNLS